MLFDCEIIVLGVWLSVVMVLGIYNFIFEVLDFVCKNKENIVFNLILSNIEIYNNLKISRKNIYNVLYKRF